MPEQTSAAPCGLVTRSGAPIPLTGVSVEADVRALGARVTVTQRYHNAEPQPIEAVYVFPLDEGAAVCGFEALIDGVRIVGEVKEREEAFRVYDDAMAAGHGAYLLDEERPDVFQASIGNLPPGARVDLTIVYVAELETVDDGVRFAVPTTVSPRYAPAEDRKGVGRPDSEALNPPLALEVSYGLDLRVRVATPRRPTRVSSPSHPIDVAFEGDAVVVSLAQHGAPLDRDFVLAVEGGGFETPSAWIESSPKGDRAVAVSFVPRLPDTRQPAEVVFVVDRSGSMQGESIAEVRNALELCLRSMTPGCRFNIVGFGSRVETLFPDSRAYDDRSLAAASDHVRALDANLGGTEILEPLRRVFAQRPAEGEVRQVVVLTDGEVTNTDAVLALIRSHASTHRVFAFGIGAGASAHLVRGMARAGGGAAEFVAPRERIEGKVLRLMARLLSPALTGVRVTWQGLDVVQAPSTPPAIFHGSRLVLYGFIKDVQDGRLRLEAVGPSGPISFEVPVRAEDAVPGLVVSTLAARARIRELEESPEWLQARGSRQQRGRPSTASREIVELATRYGLVSRETSYVAIEQREVPVVGDVQLRQVPIALTHGWGGTAPRGVPAMDMTAMPAAAFLRVDTGAMGSLLAPHSARPSLARRVGTEIQRLAARARFDRGRGPDDREDVTASERTPDAVRERMISLVQLQSADGSWEAGDALARAVGRTSHEVNTALDDLLAEGGLRRSIDLERAWATALALAWLDAHASGLADEWRLVAGKGRSALDARVSSADVWLSAARALVI